MGVDLNTYRCRVGSFVSCLSAGDGRGATVRQGATDGQDADGMSFFVSMSKLIKLIRTLIFIGILLIMVVIVLHPGSPVVEVGMDIDSYWCRIGMFVPHRGAGVMCMPFYFDYSVMVKCIGTVSFIRLLLIRAGIEQNPGPADKFIFRYQYLLIKLGTDVLRKVFEDKAGNNVVQYLTAKSQDIQSLIKARVITADQKLLLPPINNQPDSSNFDVTLLSCLLRNICGLRQPKDLVWTKPAIRDTSIEADITRLRMCRNQLVHSDKLVLPEADLSSKWQDLSVILLRLNNVGGIPQLQSDINNADIMEIDEQLRKQHDKTLQAWHESDRLLEQRIDEVVSAVTSFKKDLVGVNRRLDDVELTQQEIKRQQKVDHTDIQQKLREVYLASCSRLALSPLFKDEHKELLKIYKIPSLFVVDYHKAKIDQKTTEVTSCMDIFYKDQKPCKNIYITGDAGVGKSSFCMYLSLLWTMSKLGNKINNDRMQKDADFFAKFDYLFCVTLRDTDRTDVIAMIVDQLFNTECVDKWSKIYESVDNILKCEDSLVILDGLDEWKPEQRGKKDFQIPFRPTGKKCLYVTTCRPYKIENVRLLHEDLDQQLQMTGIHGSSMEFYVAEIFNHVNEKYSENKDPVDFFREVKQCGLHELLCIPIITSHLIMIWLDQPLTAMSRSLIYGNIVDMLFKIAKDREVEFPASISPELQLPDSLSKLQYFTEHFSLLEKVCLLSFRSLFKQDECVTNLVFSNQQLMSQPYFLSSSEVDVLCKIGILSKNKVNRRFGKQEHKLSFLHQSYLEFFAAIFVSSIETGKLSDTFNKLMTINEVLYLENFFLFFAGFSFKKLEYLFEQFYVSLSDELTLCRKNAIFHYNKSVYTEQISTLQNIVINCFKDGSKFSHENVYLKLEDFVFNDGPYVDYLRQLLLLNTRCVKSMHSVKGKYYEEFHQIKNLQCLHVGYVLSGDYVKFTECMLQNQSTLHTVCIEGSTLIPELPVRSLQHLTSLSLSGVKMRHYSLRNLVKCLSDNVLIENIKLSCVYCDNHQDDDSECTLTLNLPKHTKLTSLCLWYVNILCKDVNNSSLKSIKLSPLSERIGRGYIDVFGCIECSQLTHIYIKGWDRLDNNTMKTFTHTVKTLPYIKSLVLYNMKLPDVSLQLHHDVTQVKIKLNDVTMSRKCFHCFIKQFVNNKSVIKVELFFCKITSVDGETLSKQESVDYMSEYLMSIRTVNITCKDDTWLHFETRSFQ